MFNKKIIQILKREEGSGLIMALMTLMVLSVLGISLGMITVNGFRLSHINRDSTSVYYIAEAGANQAYEDIRSEVLNSYKDAVNPDSFFNDSKVTSIDGAIFEYNFDSQNGKTPHANVQIRKTGQDEQNMSNEYVIQSKGTIGNSSRTVEKPFKVNWVNDKTSDEYLETTRILSTMVSKRINFANQGVSVTGLDGEGSRGAVQIDTTNPDYVRLPNNARSLHLDIYLPNAFDRNKFVNKDNVVFKEMPQNIDWSLYDALLNQFPEFPTELNSSYFDKSSNTVNTNGENVRIVVDSLTLDNLTINGGGRVDFFVNNSLSLRGNINHTGSPDQLQIFYQGKNNVSLDSVNYKGSIFSKAEEADFDTANGVQLSGVLLTGANKVSLGSTQSKTLIIAPNATVEFNTASNDNKITGLIVAKYINFRNNVTIMLDDTYLKEFPLVIPGFADDKYSEYGEVIEPGPIFEMYIEREN